jgi:SAM-dependent methyltransferase
MAENKPWHEQDLFWETAGSILFTSRRWQLAQEEIDGVLGLLQVAPGARILDLCCGAGRHALELARRGYVVTGVDRTQAFLDEAALRAGDEGLRISWVHADMRAYCQPGTFDGAINLFTSFGYFRDAADDRRVAANVLRSLKPGGVLVIDLMGKEILARRFQARDWSEEKDGTLLLQERSISDGWDWMENRWIIIKGDRRHDLHLSHRLYSAAELSALLRDVGFARAVAYGDLQDRPYDLEARRLVVVAQK